MSVKNCKKCGKLFNYYPGGPKICSDCQMLMEEDFKKVKEYIYENPGTNINQVSENTGVSVRDIIEFLKEERLEAAEGMSPMLTCERCGKPIKSGRHCDKCIQEMKTAAKKLLNEAGAKKEVTPEGRGSKMHIDELRRK